VFIFISSIIICRFFVLPLSDQAQVTLKLTASISDVVTRYLAGPPSLMSLTKLFPPGPNPALVGPESASVVEHGSGYSNWTCVTSKGRLEKSA
jgi:hypothetical protein